MYPYSGHEYLTRAATGTLPPPRVDPTMSSTDSPTSSQGSGSASEYGSPYLQRPGANTYKTSVAQPAARPVGTTPSFPQPQRAAHVPSLRYRHSDNPADYSPPRYHTVPTYEPHPAYTAAMQLKVPPAPTEDKLKGPWQRAEDEALVFWAVRLGTARWVDVAARVGSRTGKQCRERWTNQLSPEIDHSPFRPEEDDLIIRMQASMDGNHWREVAKHLPGRPENTIKNRFNSTIVQRKKAEIEHNAMIANYYGQHGYVSSYGDPQTNQMASWSQAYPSPAPSRKRSYLDDTMLHGEEGYQGTGSTFGTDSASDASVKRARSGLAGLNLHKTSGGESAPHSAVYSDASAGGAPRSWPVTPLTPAFGQSSYYPSSTAASAIPPQYATLPPPPPSSAAGTQGAADSTSIPPNWTTNGTGRHDSLSGSLGGSPALGGGLANGYGGDSWFSRASEGRPTTASATSTPGPLSTASYSYLPSQTNKMSQWPSSHTASSTTAGHGVLSLPSMGQTLNSYTLTPPPPSLTLPAPAVSESQQSPGGKLLSPAVMSSKVSWSPGHPSHPIMPSSTTPYQARPTTAGSAGGGAPSSYASTATTLSGDSAVVGWADEPRSSSVSVKGVGLGINLDSAAYGDQGVLSGRAKGLDSTLAADLVDHA